MPLRPPAGFIRPGYDPLEVPDAPTIGTATGGDESASVAFTAPSDAGGAAISEYYAVSNPDQVTATAASSPVSVTGLTNGTAYTFRVWALNSYGPSPYSAASGSVTPYAGIGLFGGGLTTGNVAVNTIDYVTISTTGNATDFGDISSTRCFLASAASTTRGLFAGGSTTSNTNTSVVTTGYVTIASVGNTTNFGDLTLARQRVSGCSSTTRAVLGGGVQTNASNTNVLDYFTIASTGNATDFGDLTSAIYSTASCSSPTRGLWAGGASPAVVNTIDYITIASAGNATDFGDLNRTSYQGAGCSSSITGMFSTPGNDRLNKVVYVTIASTGNSSDFGNLTETTKNNSACSSNTRALFAGGEPDTGGVSNVICYFTIASTGNATDFGDLTQTRYGLAGCSNSAGGVQ